MAVAGPLQALESLVRELCGQVRSYGWCTDSRIIRDQDHLNFSERIRVAFRMMDGRDRVHEISLHELAMQPEHVGEIFRNWRRNVILDLEAHHAPIATAMNRQREQQMEMMQQQMMAQRGANQYQGLGNYANQLGAYYPNAAQAQMNQMAGLQQWAQTQTQANPEVEARSKELFVSACGKDAYEKLNAGKSLELTGSKGGKYTLHKRSSFCVERPSDGARLCAVVPGVPLWDHLLGIKLMIEHDEPKFLKTANVAGGNIAQGSNRNSGGALGTLGGVLGNFFS